MVMLATGLIVFYGYAIEVFYAWYSGNHYEWFMMKNRITGPYWQQYWTLILCNGLVPQLIWFKRFRYSAKWLFFVSMFVNVGMWLERFVIVITSLHRDFLPSSWGMYQGTRWDWATFTGTIGLFLTLIFLFVRVLPMISIAEVRVMTPEGQREGVEDAHP